LLAQSAREGPSLDLAAATALVQDWISSAETSTVASEPRVLGLLEDMKGQVSEAISRQDYYERWGKHYIPSLATAHRDQKANNFKDPGVQRYGGELFTSLRDEADDVFMSLPPPERENPESDPVFQQYLSQAGLAGAAASVAPAPRAAVNMAVYNNAYGGCFDGNCVARVKQTGEDREKWVPVRSLRRGDLVVVPGTDGANSVATIECVVETRFPTKCAELVAIPSPHSDLGPALSTPFHPVRLPDSKWRFPLDVHDPVEVSCEAVYTFILNSGHVMSINGVDYCTLGHGFAGPKIGHSFFGAREKVTRNLMQFKGWSRGHVTLHGGSLLRDPDTSLVTGFDPAMEIV